MSLGQLLSRLGRPIDEDTFVMNGGLVVRVSPLTPRWTLFGARGGASSKRRPEPYLASWWREQPATPQLAAAGTDGGPWQGT